MSDFPNIDKLDQEATDAREQCEKAIRDAMPPGALIDVKMGPEWMGPYEVQDYPRYSYSHVTLRNVETGTERREPYHKCRLSERQPD